MPLDKTLKDVQKRFAGIVVTGAELNPVAVISTGSLALDIALGVGGIPRGRITEIYGLEASGKTTLCLSIIAEAQRMGGVGVFIDAECGFDPLWARKCRVNLERLYVVRPRTGEQALEVAGAFIRSGEVDVVVIDSVAALVTGAEVEGEMGDAHVGAHSALMSRALRKLTAALMHSPHTALIFTNQIRLKRGVLFGSPEITTGGMALKFYASVRLRLECIQAVRLRGEIIGNRIRAWVQKNKVAPPFREAEFDILYDEGISRESDILDLGLQYGLIERRGTCYSYRSTNLGQGREHARIFLKEHSRLAGEIESEIRRAAGLATVPAFAFAEAV